VSVRDGDPRQAIRTAVKAALITSGRTQKGLAEELGLSEKHVSQVLTGRQRGGWPMWVRMASSLGVDFSVHLSPGTASQEAMLEALERDGPWRPGGGAQVYSVRVPAACTDRLRERAGEAGVHPAALIRQWVEDRLAGPPATAGEGGEEAPRPASERAVRHVDEARIGTPGSAGTVTATAHLSAAGVFAMLAQADAIGRLADALRPARG
jgi:hypothetical protein